MRRYVVAHGAGGFLLSVEKISPLWVAAEAVAGTICQITGHRWCDSGLIGWALGQGYRQAETLAQISIDRTTARTLSPKNYWDWLDEDDEV